jgi:methylated-DNA-protein-cysteine methyltransferase-like protein
MMDFKREVYSLVSKIPPGRVMTYGQIAVLCGRPRAARVVGGIAHNGPDKLPWHRVVKSGGKLAEGFPGGVLGHQQALEQEGLSIRGGVIANFEEVTWRLSDEKR